MSDSSASPRPFLGLGKRQHTPMTEEELEPYVRRKRASDDGEGGRRRMEGLNEQEQHVMRTSINSRERKRMHDLNEALEELRSVLPYQDPSQRKMSKINTLLLASNWIRQLTNANATLRAELAALRLVSTPEEKPSPPLPSLPSLPSMPFTLPCQKTFRQPCFCISCIVTGGK